MTEKTVFILVTGRVQGVGFRYFARQKAIETGIRGWVRNSAPGHVEIEASGMQKDLNTFIDWIKIGPTRAIIKTVSITEIPNERQFTNFSIR